MTRALNIDTSTHSASTAELVTQTLADDRRYHPNLGGITRGGIANHYPMTILALQGLDASPDEIRNFQRSWPRHRAALEDLGLRDSGTLNQSNWPDFLGRSEKLLEFRRVFSELLEQASVAEVLGQTLGVMRNSLPMGLFHPLIRLSFATGHGDRGMIADALAYMAIRYREMYAELADAPADAEAPTLRWQQVSQSQDLPHLPPAGAIPVCEQLCAFSRLQELAGSGSESVAAICRLALRLYLYEPALSTLHAVTSAQALAELDQRYGQAQPALFRALWQRYWIWLTGLYYEKGRPAQLPEGLPADQEPAGWDLLAAQARAIPEVHLIKMAYSCRWLDQAFGPDPLYRVAVSAMIREGRAHPRQGFGLSDAALA